MNAFSDALLSWYDDHARELPWRVSPADRARGIRPDPYRVWLSEIMLQQTTIPHGIRYFLRFTELWPTVDALADADRDDIMREWAGLGYYARARNLHACAKAVVTAGGFPADIRALQALPGIGPYTAGAIASIAFDVPAAAVDGNVERVLSRYLAIEAPLTEIKPQLKDEAAARVPAKRAGDFAQAFMDLGATICTPRNPDCARCPVSSSCLAFSKGIAERFPIKAKKQPKPVRYGQTFLIHHANELVVERRPDKGLLAGMLGLPTTEWMKLDSEKDLPEPSGAAGRYLGRVEHVFTHFRLYLDVFEQTGKEITNPLTVSLDEAMNSGLPSVFAKAVRQLQR